MELRKPKFVGKKTKWEKRRIVRRFTRTVKGKKLLAEPLTIAPAKERQAALKEGKMVFYDGEKRIEIQLLKKVLGVPSPLQGIWKEAKGRIIALRLNVRIPGLSRLEFYELVREPAIGLVERTIGVGDDFVSVERYLGHLLIPQSLRGQGLALKSASKAERHVRAQVAGWHSFYPSQFEALFAKLGYRKIPLNGVEKRGKFQPKDNLNEFHRIEAIDPKTGKARIFTFPIQKTSSN